MIVSDALFAGFTFGAFAVGYWIGRLQGHVDRDDSDQ